MGWTKVGAGVNAGRWVVGWVKEFIPGTVKVNGVGACTTGLEAARGAMGNVGGRAEGTVSVNGVAGPGKTKGRAVGTGKGDAAATEGAKGATADRGKASISGISAIYVFK